MATSQLTTASMLHLMEVNEHPEEEIKASVGDLKDFEWSDDSILCGIYIQPGKTKGGIITSAMSKQSVYQGKVGLVLKLPAKPFADDRIAAWGGKPPKVGDWLVFNPNDGQMMSIMGAGAKPSQRMKDIDFELYAGWPCTLIQEKFVYGRIKDPTAVV